MDIGSWRIAKDRSPCTTNDLFGTGGISASLDMDGDRVPAAPPRIPPANAPAAPALISLSPVPASPSCPVAPSTIASSPASAKPSVATPTPPATAAPFARPEPFAPFNMFNARPASNNSVPVPNAPYAKPPPSAMPRLSVPVSSPSL